MTAAADDREKERIREVAQLLHRGCRPLRILQAIAWAPEVKERFFAQGARELPEVTYVAFDPTPTIDAVREARRRIVGDAAIDLWLDRHAQGLELGARMLAAVGTQGFFEYARQVYGEPTAPTRYVPVTPLDLAQSVHDTIAQLARVDIQVGPPVYHSSEVVAEDLERAVNAHFGDQAPAIELDRLRRLADRVFAIQMAVEGADFLDVYRWFLERVGDTDPAFENARRVFRGGLVTGGAPFTKDVVYLLGLLQVTNFVRASFAAGRADCLSLLFCGKLDLLDIPALCQLYALGLCRD